MATTPSDSSHCRHSIAAVSSSLTSYAMTTLFSFEELRMATCAAASIASLWLSHGSIWNCYVVPYCLIMLMEDWYHLVGSWYSLGWAYTWMNCVLFGEELRWMDRIDSRCLSGLVFSLCLSRGIGFMSDSHFRGDLRSWSQSMLLSYYDIRAYLSLRRLGCLSSVSCVSFCLPSLIFSSWSFTKIAHFRLLSYSERPEMRACISPCCEILRNDFLVKLLVLVSLMRDKSYLWRCQRYQHFAVNCF